MVEPSVPMDELVKATLKHGMMPQVVSALPGTTVGGSFSGISGDSSSFKFGLFDRSVTWLEVILPDGKITRACQQRSLDLFLGMIGTMGTIGIVTLLQIQLVRASPYVEITYLPVKSTTEAIDTILRCSQDRENDFVEGLVYGAKASSYGVVTVGKLSADKAHTGAQFRGARDPWFDLHALEARGTTKTIPIMDYLFRHDRGLFGLGRFCLDRMLQNKWTQWLTDSATRSRELTQTVQSMQWAEHMFVQDLMVPFESSVDLLQFLEKDLKIYPLRLCPIRQWPDSHTIMRPNPRSAQLCMSIGIRGFTEDTITTRSKFIQKNRDIEDLVYGLGGVKWLYARNHYTEDEFWKIYPREEYEALRKKYGAEHLASIYDKIKISDEPRNVKPKGFWGQIFASTSVLAVKQMKDHHR